MGYIYPWVKSEIARAAWAQKQYLEKIQLVGDIKLINQEEAPSPEEKLICIQDKLVIKNILKNMNMDSAKIISETYGLDVEKRSLREVASQLGVSHETVRKKQLRAMKILAERYIRYR